ncbi:MAG TPA: hypothetical protein VK151_02900 [Fluviicola sp.]|nr:hypothetical protein [Fluviicola sp.]
MFAAFLGLITWLYFTPEDISCVYVQKGLSCPTCGLTRAFRAIITLDSSVEINPLHGRIVYFCLIQFFLRLTATLWSYYKTTSRKWIITDIILSVLLFVWAFYVLLPFVG